MRQRFWILTCLCFSLVASVPGVTYDTNAAQSAPRKRANQNKRKKNGKKPTAKQRAAQKAAAARRQRTKKIANRRKKARKNGAKRGKNTPSKKRPASRKRSVKKKPTKAAPRKAAKVRVEIRDWKETQKLIAKDKGKIVVVDVWASWCDPCLKELPKLVALQKRFPKDVAAVSFNVDNGGDADSAPAKIEPAILKQLTKFKAVNVRNIISLDPDEDVYKKMKIDSVPTILVYGRDGKLAKTFDVNSAGGKDVTYAEHVVPFVKELLKTK